MISPVENGPLGTAIGQAAAAGDYGQEPTGADGDKKIQAVSFGLFVVPSRSRSSASPLPVFSQYITVALNSNFEYACHRTLPPAVL